MNKIGRNKLFIFVWEKSLLHRADFFNSRVKWETERNELRKLRMKIIENVSYDFGTEISPERMNYVYFYTGLIVIVLYLVFQRSLALFYFCLKAARRMHEKLFDGICHAQMLFFNQNSSGRIINRFSKDTNDIDYYLPTVLYDSILVCVRILFEFELNCAVVHVEIEYIY